VDPRTVLIFMEKTIISCLSLEKHYDFSVVQLVAYSLYRMHNNLFLQHLTPNILQCDGSMLFIACAGVRNITVAGHCKR